jgi:hypothetical protein
MHFERGESAHLLRVNFDMFAIGETVLISFFAFLLSE